MKVVFVFVLFYVTLVTVTNVDEHLEINFSIQGVIEVEKYQSVDLKCRYVGPDSNIKPSMFVWMDENYEKMNEKETTQVQIIYDQETSHLVIQTTTKNENYSCSIPNKKNIKSSWKFIKISAGNKKNKSMSPLLKFFLIVDIIVLVGIICSRKFLGEYVRRYYQNRMQATASSSSSTSSSSTNDIEMIEMQS